MAWSYNGNPGASTLNQVRFLIQDTDSCDQLMQDEEISWLLTREGSVDKAALKAAETLMSKFARFVDEAVGQVRVSYSQRYDHYKDLVKKLEEAVAIKGAAPFCGGISIAQKEVLESNSDRVEPFFTRDLHDYPKETDTDEREGGQ